MSTGKGINHDKLELWQCQEFEFLLKGFKNFQNFENLNLRHQGPEQFGPILKNLGLQKSRTDAAINSNKTSISAVIISCD